MSRRHRARKKMEYQTFHFEIDACVPNYSFSVEQMKWRSLTYSEYLALEIDTTCLSPLKAKGRTCRLIFLGDREIAVQERDKRPEGAPSPAIGSLRLRGPDFDYLGTLPHDAIWPLWRAIERG